MSKIILSASIGLLTTLSMAQVANGQQSIIYHDPDQHYKLGLELYQKQKYAAANKEFHLAMEESSSNWHEMKSNAEYYAAACSIELFNNNAGLEMEKFLRHHPESPKAKPAAFYLGKYYYRQKDYKSSIKWFQKVDATYLSNEEAAEFYFKQGYSVLSQGDFNKALKSFNEVKNTESKYAPAAGFYYAHIQYMKKNYDEALPAFEKLKDSKSFGKVVPYYIAQIYYHQDRLDNLIAYASPLMEQAAPDNAKELAHMLGDAYFKKGQYENALPLLESYHANSIAVKNSDHYQLGITYYYTKNIEKAISNLEHLVDGRDSIAQHALYVLADCYIKTDNKSGARNAFLLASKMSFSNVIAEDAKFNFAKLSCELNFQSEAVEAFRDFLKQYPNSFKRDEASGLLAELFLVTRNYKEALASLESVKTKNDRVKKAYQKVAYYRGVELYNETDLPAAIKLFDKSLQYTNDPKVAGLAKFWKAEALFKQGSYDQAIKNYSEFANSSGVSSLDEYDMASYGIAYCYLKKDNYGSALSNFRRYLNSGPSDRLRYDDALLRMGDCSFMEHNYEGAVLNYDLAIQRRAAGSDYAMFQKAVILGIQNRIDEKIIVLERLTNDYTSSPYHDDALFELAAAYSLKNDNIAAINMYDDLVSRFPQSTYVKKALLAIALIYYNENRDDKAIELYKQVVEKFPSTPEANEALTGMRNIYVEQGRGNEYLQFANGLSFTTIKESAKDSILYEAAELKYMKGDCEAATADFNNYLEKFPNGYFNTGAYFYRSECAYREKFYDTALEGYAYVIKHPKSTYTEKSLVRAAVISVINKDYESAYAFYERLEKDAEFPSNIIDARIGQMRCALIMKKYPLSAAAARKVLASDKVSIEQTTEAHFTYAKSAFLMDSLYTALKEYAIVAKAINTEKGAEAKYTIAFIYHDQGKYKDAEKTLLDLGNQASSDYWIAKGYILLAMNYYRLNDLFQAKATLQSIIENYEGEDLKTEARQKLDEINAAEAGKVAPVKEKEAEEELPLETTPNNNN